MDSKAIAVLVVALLVGVGAGAGIGYVAFHNNAPAKDTTPDLGEPTYFYIYDNNEYSNYHQTCYASAYNGAQVTGGIFTKAGDVYTPYAGNPYSGTALNDTYYFNYGSEKVEVLGLSYYDEATWSYVAFTETTWDDTKTMYADYVDPVPFKEANDSIVKGVWVKGYGATIKERFTNACERAGYTLTWGSYGIGTLNGLDDGNFTFCIYKDSNWTTTGASWDMTDLPTYAGVGHGAWDSAMFVAPLPGIAIPNPMIAI